MYLVIIVVLAFIVMALTGLPFFGATAVLFVVWGVIILISKLTETGSAVQTRGPTVPPETQEERDWVSTKTGDTFRGRYQGRDAGHVYVKRTDGKIAKMPSAKLSEPDRIYLAALTAPKEERKADCHE